MGAVATDVPGTLDRCFLRADVAAAHQRYD